MSSPSNDAPILSSPTLPSISKSNSSLQNTSEGLGPSASFLTSTSSSIFSCPITGVQIQDPVMAPDGRTYERNAIEKWLIEHHSSPFTRQPMSITDLKPNHMVRDYLEHVNKNKERHAKEHIPSETKDSVPEQDSSPKDGVVEEKVSDAEWKEIPQTLTNPSFQISRSTYEKRVCLSIQTLSNQPMESVFIMVLDVSGSMECNASKKPSSEGVYLSRLTLVKHSMRTIIPMLQERSKFAGNSLGIVTFSTTAKIALPITRMTEEGAKKAEEIVDSLRADGATNLYGGLKLGFVQAQIAHTVSRGRPQNVHIVVLTDGEPSGEEVPNHTLVRELEKLVPQDRNFTISCFGFGCNLQSKLLERICVLGNGSYGYIPDSTMVGPTFINYVAAVTSTVTTNVKLHWGSQNFWMGAIQAESKRHFILPSALMHIVPTDTQQWRDHVSLTYNDNQQVVSAQLCFEECEDSQEALHSLLVRYLQKALRRLTCGTFENIKPRPLKDLRRFIGAMSVSNDFIQSVLRDIKSNAEHEGQLSKAIQNKEVYQSWGLNYLIGYVRGLELELCLNCKDAVLQHFLSPLCKKIQNRGNDIFCLLPPPEGPLGMDQKTLDNDGDEEDSTYNPFVRRGFGSTTVSMAQYSCSSSAGCVDGDCLVKMVDSSLRPMKDLRLGDAVDGGFRVLAVVETKLSKPVPMVSILDGPTLTPWHPVQSGKPGSQWVFPCTLVPPSVVAQHAYYNLILDNGHTITIGSYRVCTLGHNFQDNNVITHPYFGTDAVLQDLRTRDPEGYQKGWIVLHPDTVQRNPVSHLVEHL